MENTNDTKNLINDTKKCGRCGRILPISEFGKNKAQKDNLQSWCKECQNGHQKQTHNQFKNQFKGYYLYIIQDKNNQIVYVGQTTNYYNRLMHHLSGYVDSTKELFSSGNWGCIKYLNVEHIVESDLELRVLENALIELYEPKLNKVKNIIRDVDKDRLFSLVAQLHSILNEWEIFKTNKCITNTN